MKILVHGATGKTGGILKEYIHEDTNHELSGLIVSSNSSHLGKDYMGIRYSNKLNNLENTDVIIDFSNHQALESLLNQLIKSENYLPLITGTTDLKDSTKNLMHKYAEQGKIIASYNFSIGIKIMRKAINTILENITEDFDIELIEAHHRNKKDAPSGTLLTIADDIMDYDNHYCLNFDRLNSKISRKAKEIGISSIRGGNIFGEHDAIFISNEEKISISHQAFNRKIFAKGAVIAAEFLFNQDQPGIYDWDSM